MTRPIATSCAWLAAMAALLLLGGCLQLDLHVLLEPGGGATVTERLQFSRRLLDLGGSAGGDLQLAPLLEKAAILDRMKQMGRGVTLVSHEVRDAEKGARESAAVFHVDDLNELRYVSPFLAFADYAKNNVVRFQMVPLLKSRNYVGTAGEMAVSLKLLKPPQNQPQRDENNPATPGPTPRQLQIYRELQPVFKDMMQGFSLKLTFESYAPLTGTGFGLRDHRAGTHVVDLIDVSDQDLDALGSSVLDNEEVMLDLLQGDYGSQDIVKTVGGFQDNKTVPLLLTWGSPYCPWHPGDEIVFAPSRQLFDRYFAGKKLDYSRWAPNPPDKHVEAKFEKIGWDPDRNRKKDPDKDKPAPSGDSAKAPNGTAAP
ncbi:MAG: hypothetical protein BIFFINMI_03906 [Phycisphaerae bacterium]|nr:hypothetical protein [Phycisphaerae bacterium]